MTSSLYKGLLSDIEELNPVHSSGIIRLPEMIGVPFSGRIRSIVDHPHFQRLRKVRQLSLTYLVYPGAVHTRFEHSLGVFETTTHYISALLSNISENDSGKVFKHDEIESLLVAALLHDIGHYPFAHLLEDLAGEVAEHIDLVRLFLSGDIGKIYPSLKLSDDVPSLGEVIEKSWPNVNFDDVCYFISGKLPKGGYSDEEKDNKALLRSILDGPVDADKMDYLYRDSIHCGVPYGRFIDRDRFFQSLTRTKDRPDTIAIDEKGRICVELFAYARSAMFSEVYWHHSARAVTAMLNRALCDAVASNSAFSGEKIVDLAFDSTDEEMIEWMSKNGGSRCRELMKLLHERKLYKRLLVIQSPEYPTLFEMLDKAKWYKGIDFNRLQERFIERVNDKGIFKDIRSEPLRPHDILVDVPLKRSGLPDVPIIQEYRDNLDVTDAPAGVWSGIKQDFERWVRKIRVFCHPSLQEDLFKATGSSRPDERLRERLINSLTEIVWTDSQGMGHR